MANPANFCNGEYRTMPYTPGANVAAGDIISLGTVTANTAGTGALAVIAHRPIENGIEGTVAIGGGVYNCTIASNYAVATMLYKQPGSNNILVSTSTNNARFGPLLVAAAAANDVRRVLHSPAPAA
jgi:hypothetical protein